MRVLKTTNRPSPLIAFTHGIGKPTSAPELSFRGPTSVVLPAHVREAGACAWDRVESAAKRKRVESVERRMRAITRLTGNAATDIVIGPLRCHHACRAVARRHT